MGFKIKNVNIIVIHRKIRFLGGGEVHRKTNIRAELPQKGERLDSWQF